MARKTTFTTMLETSEGILQIGTDGSYRAKSLLGYDFEERMYGNDAASKPKRYTILNHEQALDFLGELEQGINVDNASTITIQRRLIKQFRESFNED